MPSSLKQAVLLIHGIGEQRPMDTLRGFVDAVWKRNRALHHPHAKAGVFSKPDEASGSYELRRLTTTKDQHNVRTDFYEFYWAHLMPDTTLGHVWPWVRHLLGRRPGSLSPELRGVWWLLLGILLLTVGLLLLTFVLPEPYKWISAALSPLAAATVVPVINNFIGDAARYLTPLPVNIQRRQEIRSKGVELLRRLHDSGQYQRIILVGHSLGSVIGYDVLTHAWPAFAAETRLGPNPELNALEALTPTPASIGAFQQQQHRLWQEQRARGSRWLVTDFVTLGSPLAHADVLLARDRADLTAKQAERELPTCPPWREDGQRFSYPAARAARRLHHAAVFGPTRWSNLYFPARHIVRGDIVGGPLSPVFGAGVRDYRVSTRLWRGFLSHTHYWTPDPADVPNQHIDALREALNLLNTEVQPADAPAGPDDLAG
jgi:hypothetical protein